MNRHLRMNARILVRLSRDAEGIKNVIGEAVEEANRTILIKGVSKEHVDEAAKITSWSVYGDTIELIIESGPMVRATAGALRFKKLIESILGKKHRIGVRDLDAENIEFSIYTGSEPDPYTRDRIMAIPNVSKIEYESGRVKVTIGPMGEYDLKNNTPDRLIARVKEILETPEKPPPPMQTQPIVKRGDEKEVKFSKDPVQTALELGWIKEFPGRGQWIYTTPYSELFTIIRNMLIDEVAKKLGFQQFMLPKLIPLDVMRKMPGYLDDIPEGMYYCFPPPRDPEAFREFKEVLKITKKVSAEKLKEALKDPEYVLAPAQCEPFWQFYGQETFSQEDYPYKLYDASGYTYRWEGGGAEGLVRLHEFQRIELTYLGTPKQVVEIRDSILERCIYVADKLLDMEWRVTAAIPFWARGGIIDVDIHKSDEVPAYDLEIYLPYRGKRESSEWLEVAGCFIHKTKFVDSFNIREVKNRETWTGCSGLGLTRWVAAFLATHGFNYESWPKNVGEHFDKHYMIPKSLQWPPKR
ncbi:serine--tRNA ligase [Candidatus Bathyarchaeota archaeon]|nr:serine--tRNA ligase [Candidatus Bathyarchaeota archaeon]